jgi:uncharacterized protein (TIGR02145 family)
MKLKIMKRKFLLILFFITLSRFLSAQSITNVQSKQEGNTIAVTYDLQCDSEATISLFVSEDGGVNFTGPLVNVSGDVGSDIKSSSNKKIVWDVIEDRDYFYGNNIVFRVKAVPKYVTMIDSRDNRTYKTVIIGSQIWMAENLNYSTASGSWCYDDNKDNCQKYGRLYDWQTAINVCPIGWRLPSKSDFETLLANVGDSANNAFYSLKDGGSSNFSALPGGYRYKSGRFGYIDDQGVWRTSTVEETHYLWIFYSNFSYGFVSRLYYDDNADYGYSVRCIKD